MPLPPVLTTGIRQFLPVNPLRKSLIIAVDALYTGTVGFLIDTGTINFLDLSQQLPYASELFFRSLRPNHTGGTGIIQFHENPTNAMSLIMLSTPVHPDVPIGLIYEGF